MTNEQANPEIEIKLDDLLSIRPEHKEGWKAVLNEPWKEEMLHDVLLMHFYEDVAEKCRVIYELPVEDKARMRYESFAVTDREVMEMKPGSFVLAHGFKEEGEDKYLIELQETRKEPEGQCFLNIYFRNPETGSIRKVASKPFNDSDYTTRSAKSAASELFRDIRGMRFTMPDTDGSEEHCCDLGRD